MSNLTAQKRRKNNIVHVFTGDRTRKNYRGDTVEVGVCGSCSKENSGNTVYDVDRGEVLDNEYLVVDGDIIGKFCGNCSATLTSSNFE